MVGEPNCPIHDPNSCQTSELVDGGPFSSIVLALSVKVIPGGTHRPVDFCHAGTSPPSLQ